MKYLEGALTTVAKSEVSPSERSNYEQIRRMRWKCVFLRVVWCWCNLLRHLIFCPHPPAADIKLNVAICETYLRWLSKQPFLTEQTNTSDAYLVTAALVARSVGRDEKPISTYQQIRRLHCILCARKHILFRRALFYGRLQPLNKKPPRLQLKTSANEKFTALPFCRTESIFHGLARIFHFFLRFSKGPEKWWEIDQSRWRGFLDCKFIVRWGIWDGK
jgi:hypothetical protein